MSAILVEPAPPLPAHVAGGSVHRTAGPLRRFDLVLFSISAIVVADTVGASAAIGVQGLTIAAGLILLFVLPYGLITAELGSAWPQEGGLYVWVREAFGPGAGSLASWLYWIHVAFWMPAVFVLVTGTLAAAFAPGLPRWGEALIVVALIWCTVGIGVVDLRVGKWVPNASAVLNVTVLVGLGVLGLLHALRHGVANPFDGHAFAPTWGAGAAFLPVIVYAFMGFELMSAAGGEMRNPRRDVPAAIGVSGVTAAAVYLAASFGILALVPVGRISIVSGIGEALRAACVGMFGSVRGGPGGAVYAVAVVAVLATFVGNIATWAMGCNRSIAVTGVDRAAPALFGHRHARFGTPDHAFVVMGCVATAITAVNFGLFGSREDVFWSVFSVAAILFLTPYLLLFPAAVALRVRHPTIRRPFRVPGGGMGMWLAASVCQAVMLAAVAMFFVDVPAGTPATSFRLVTAVGTVVGLVGVGLYRWGRGGPEAPATE